MLKALRNVCLLICLHSCGPFPRSGCTRCEDGAGLCRARGVALAHGFVSTVQHPPPPPGKVGPVVPPAAEIPEASGLTCTSPALAPAPVPTAHRVAGSLVRAGGRARPWRAGWRFEPGAGSLPGPRPVLRPALCGLPVAHSLSKTACLAWPRRPSRLSLSRPLAWCGV